MQFCTLDIETSNLNADFGFVLCAVLKPYPGGKAEVYRIDKTKRWIKAKYDDKELIEQIVKRLNDFDGVITYNGRNFDIPFLRSQIIGYDIDRLKDMFHVDVYYLTRYKLRLHNAKLFTLIEFLNTYRSGKKRIEEKTAINSNYYKRAITGDTKGINALVDHCVRDVVALEQCYDFLKREMKSLSRSYM